MDEGVEFGVGVGLSLALEVSELQNVIFVVSGADVGDGHVACGDSQVAGGLHVAPIANTDEVQVIVSVITPGFVEIVRGDLALGKLNSLQAKHSFNATVKGPEGRIERSRRGEHFTGDTGTLNYLNNVLTIFIGGIAGNVTGSGGQHTRGIEDVPTSVGINVLLGN